MMKKALGVLAVAGLAIFLVISMAQAERKDAPSGHMGMMGQGGMMGHGGMMGQGAMMKPGMMHGVMGGGMMGGQAMDPKMQGEMMVLKGQMMIKQGDWMIKQGKKQAAEAGK